MRITINGSGSGDSISVANDAMERLGKEGRDNVAFILNKYPTNAKQREEHKTPITNTSIVQNASVILNKSPG